MGTSNPSFKVIIWSLILVFFAAGVVPAATACGIWCGCETGCHRQENPSHHPAHKQGLHEKIPLSHLLDDHSPGSLLEHPGLESCCHEGLGGGTCDMVPSSMSHVFKDMAPFSVKAEAPPILILDSAHLETANPRDIGRAKEAFLPLKASPIPFYIHHLSLLI